MKKAEERREKILELLKKDPKISQLEISEKLGIKIRTLKEDYKELKLQGHIIGYKTQEKLKDTARSIQKEKKTKELVKNNQYFRIMPSKKAVQAVLLFCALAEDMSIDEIDQCQYEEYVASRSTIIRSLIPMLKNNGLVKKEGRSWKPDLLYMTSLPKDFSKLLSFTIHCRKKRRLDIYKQAMTYLDGNSMIFSTKRDNMLWKLPFYIQTLKKLGADQGPVSFMYKGKQVRLFYLGFVAYSSDKDAVYLVGTTKPIRMDYYDVLKVDEIEWETMEKAYDKNFEKLRQDRKRTLQNRCYFRKLQAEMFDVVEDKLQSVKVCVKYSVEADYEFRQLLKARNEQWSDFEKEMGAIQVSYGSPRIVYLNAERKIIDATTHKNAIEFIEYSDSIRGIANFANYLRRFGASVEVVENDLLKKIMKNGANRALEHYTG